MGVWKWLLSLGDREPPVYLEVNRRFAVLNVDALKEKLRLEARAKARGEAEQPPSDSIELDEVEKEIVRIVEEGKARAVEQFWSDIKADNAALASIDIESEIGTIKRRGREAVANFTVEGGRGFGVLEELKRKFIQKKDDLRLFAESHGLTRSATHKSFSAKFLQIAIVVALGALEWYLNSTLLGENQAGGLIAGGQLAFLLMIANIVPAWLVGVYVWRRAIHRSPAMRLFAFSLITVWLAYVVGFNFFAGHIRDAIVASVAGGNPETLVIEYIKDHPFSLNDYKSYLLLILGIGASVIIALDAFFFDDPYYGYGAVSRARDDALEDFHVNKTEIQESLKTNLDNALAEMEAARKTAGQLVATHANALVRREATKHSFTHALDHLDSVGRDLISFYRSTNAAYRKTPAPQTFQKPYALERGDVADAGDPPTMTTARVQELVSEATQTIDQASTTLTDEFTKQAEKYARIEDII